jgi:subtilisin family serine protease
LAAEDNASGVVGVAPGASLIGVKVLGCQGGGRVEKVIKGVDWVTADAQKPANADTPAVVNMSLGTPVVKDNPETPEVEQDPLIQAVQRSAASGVFYSLSAGNLDENACNRSPARAGAGVNNGIVTTAATRKSDEEAGYSNHGRCVDLWAPGNRILSTKLGGGTTLSSGTSMAAPHVGGTAALYLSDVNGSATPVEVETVLKSTAKDTGEFSNSKPPRPIQLVSAENALLSPTP